MSIQDGKYWDKGIELVEGCVPVSEGCKHCWSASMARRFKKSLINPQTKHFNGVIVGRTDYLKRFKRKKPIKWAIWNDLFHESIADPFVDETKDAILENPQHTYMILTKRAERMRDYFYYHYHNPAIWLGVTAENQDNYDNRSRFLLNIPDIMIKYISFEPLLGPIKFHQPIVKARLKGEHIALPDWTIIGCETGVGRRPCKLEWVTDIVHQCQAAGVPVWIKQLEINGKVSKDMEKWPEELRLRQWPEVNK